MYENLSPELHPNWYRTVKITDELSCRSAYYDYQQPYCYNVVIMMMMMMEMITILIWIEHFD